MVGGTQFLTVFIYICINYLNSYFVNSGTEIRSEFKSRSKELKVHQEILSRLDLVNRSKFQLIYPNLFYSIPNLLLNTLTDFNFD